MFIISKTPYENGGFNIIQSWEEKYPVPAGFAVVPDTVDTAPYYEHNGFVFLSTEIVDGVETVTGFTPNIAAWEKWKAEQPEPTEPTPPIDERVSELETTAEQQGEILNILLSGDTGEGDA